MLEEKNVIRKDLLGFVNFKKYSGYTSEGAVFAKKIIATIKIISEKTVFQKGIANWMGKMKTVTKKFDEAKRSSTKLPPIQASNKKYEKYVYKILQERRQKRTKRCVMSFS